MTINILFLTIIINKRKKSKEEVEHDQMVAKRYEQLKDKQSYNGLL
jgi:uncharacterized protein (TIGR02413 family)